MPGSIASASNSAGRVLLVGVNWIGDTVMALPAVQAFRRLHPEAHLSVLVKPGLATLWHLHGAPDEVLTYTEPVGDMVKVAFQLRRARFDRAYVLPHSIRSALLPFWAGVPERLGVPGPGRALMMHQVCPPAEGPGRLHQGFEYADLLVPELRLSLLESPQLVLPAETLAEAQAQLKDLPQPWLAVMPGAARGPAKRWPPAHIAALARRWVDEQRGGVVLLGGRDDAAVCAEMATALGPAALNLAGQTSLPLWVSLLKTCGAVVANDSGGMHLAAAVGTPGAAVFGLTDPARTGPLGRTIRVVQDPGERRRDIARDSAEAQKRLAAISPERVYETLLEARRESTAT